VAEAETAALGDGDDARGEAEAHGDGGLTAAVEEVEAARVGGGGGSDRR
jgi:hypothetical protein